MAKFVVRDLAAVASSVPVLIKHKLSRRGKWLRFHRSGFPDTYCVEARLDVGAPERRRLLG